MPNPGRASNRVVVVGGLNYNFVFEAPRLPQAGETVVGRRFWTTRGGKAGNQAVAAARLLAARDRVAMVGCVGDDWMGREMIAGLDEAGIDRRAVRCEGGAGTGVAAIYVDASGENTVTAIYGANRLVDPGRLHDVTALLDGARVLLAQLEIPWEVTSACIRAANERGVTVILDPAPVIDLPDGTFAGVDILTPNQGEAGRWSGITVHDADSAAAAAARIRQLGPKAVLVTMGADGVYVDADDGGGHYPAYSVDAVSSLAAGDAFNGALAACIANGLGLADAVPCAAAAGALCVTKEGAQEAMPSRAEVDALLQRRLVGPRSAPQQ